MWVLLNFSGRNCVFGFDDLIDVYCEFYFVVIMEGYDVM